MRSVISVVGLGIGGVIALGYMFVGSAEGREALADMQAAEAAMCACEAGDVECGLRVQAQLENDLAFHSGAHGSEIQAMRFEQSGERMLACAERVFGTP